MFQRKTCAAAGLALAGTLAFNPLSAAIKPGDWLNGQWGTSNGGGRGITHTWVADEAGGGTLFGLVFAYNEATGEPEWLLVQSQFLEHQFVSSGQIFRLEGGSFSNPPAAPTQPAIGAFTVELNHCADSGEIVYNFDFNDGSGFPDETYTVDNIAARSTGAASVAQCAYTREFTGCPDFATDTGTGLRECLVSGQFLNEEITLTNDITWVLDGLLEIGAPGTDSSTLNIEPGTVITSVPGVNNTFIFVHAGSTINADGAPYAPIVMTSAFDGFNAEDPAPQPGQVGGLAVAGFAPCNTAPDTELGCFSEFASGDQVLPYGGQDANDSSGLIRYMQVRYAGIIVGDNQEVNSFTFLGVGAGTNVHHIQAYRSLDDGIENFGGTVNVRNFVLTDGVDDGFDWDEGWTGNVQYGLVAINDEAGSGAGFEGANNGDAFDALPRATPVFSNITVFNNPASGADDDGFQIKEGSGAQIWNSIATGYGGACLELRNQETVDAAGTPSAPTGTLAFAGSILFGCGSLFNDNNGAPAGSAEAFFTSTAFPNNLTVDPLLGPDLKPQPGSPALGNGVQVVDLATGEKKQFFDNTTFSGAFDGNDDWTEGWTFDPYGTAR